MDKSGACIAENHDPEVISLLEQVRYEADASKRPQQFADLQQYMHDKAYAIPIYEVVDSTGYWSYVKGVNESSAILGEFGVNITQLDFNRE
jgi:ABC-type transport system substrate-binding protein